MEDINLLENQLQADSKIKTKQTVSRVQKYLIIAVAVLLFLSAGFWGLGLYFVRAEKNILAKTEQAQTQLGEAAETERDRIVETQARIQNLATLLPDHLYWHDFLDDIFNAAGSEIEITSINSSAEGFMNINGSVTDFPQIADFTKTLSGVEHIKSVKLNSTSLSEKDGRVIYIFNLSVAFEKQALLFKNNGQN